MTFNAKIAGLLFKGVAKGRLSFNSALKLFRKVNERAVKDRAKSSRFQSRHLIEHMLNATAAGAHSVWTSILFPTELLCPFEIYPLTLEVLGGLFSTMGLSGKLLDLAESNDAPTTMCSFHKILLGLSEISLFQKPLFVGATSTICDGNVKSFAEAAKNQKVPFIFLDIPYEETEEGVLYVRGQLEELLVKLSDLSGKKFDKNLLNKAITNSNQAIKLFDKFHNLSKKSNKNLYYGHEIANFAFPMHFLLGSDRLVKILSAKLKDISFGNEYNKKFGSVYFNKDARRLMWLHIVPQYPTKIWDIIDNGRLSRIVCSEYTAPYYNEYNLADPLSSIAKRLINHPSNGPLERRVSHILKIAKDFNVNGIIHYSSWGCHQASGNVQLLQKKIEEAGYKFINLNGDAADTKNSSYEQHKTRLEAFLEN